MASLSINNVRFLIMCIRITCVLGYLKFDIPSLTHDLWNIHDKSLKSLLAPLHHELSSNSISPKIAGDQFIEITRNFLASNEEFVRDEENASYINMLRKLSNKHEKLKTPYVRKP